MNEGANTVEQELPRIALLPPELQNQIAAGEVIERPASIVKELIENSIDAGATQITVALVGGGMDSITVQDDGCGMGPEDLQMALQRHATSKIRNREDLHRIATLGFRGEGLAAISSISMVSMSSKIHSATHGWKYDADIGQQVPHMMEAGTRVEVKDVFARIPARRRFLKSIQTEAAHCVTWIERLSLSHSHIGFKAFKDGKEYLSLEKGQTLDARLRALNYGDGGAFYQLSYPHTEHGIEGLLQSPPRSSAQSSSLMIYVNGRFVQDKMLRVAVMSGLRGFIEVGRTPVGVLFITVPVDCIDVNVHPLKTEVRFLNSSQVFSWLEQSLRHWAQTQDWVSSESRVTFSTSVPRGVDTEGPSAPFLHQKTHSVSVTQPYSSSSEGRASTLWTSLLEKSVSPVAVTRVLGDDKSINSLGSKQELFSDQFRVLGQWQSKYVLVEDGCRLWVLDQHAVHERIRYERIKNLVESRQPLASQLLLIPEVMDVPEQTMMRLHEAQDVLEQMGWRIKFDARSIELNGHPEDVAGESVLSVFKDLADATTLVESVKDSRHLLWATQACKGAIKAGDHLSADALNLLCKDAMRVHQSAHCPHGRPSWVVFDLTQVDHLFHR